MDTKHFDLKEKKQDHSKIPQVSQFTYFCLHVPGLVQGVKAKATRRYLSLDLEMSASPSSGAAQFAGSHDEANNSYCLLNTCFVEGTVGRNSACYLINSHNSPVNKFHHFHLTNEETEPPMG